MSITEAFVYASVCVCGCEGPCNMGQVMQTKLHGVSWADTAILETKPL